MVRTSGSHTYRKQIEKILGVDVRPVVIRQRDIAVLLAVVDGLSVWDRTDLRTSYILRVWSLGTDIGIATWTVVDLAGWSRAVNITLSTPSSSRLVRS